MSDVACSENKWMHVYFRERRVLKYASCILDAYIYNGRTVRLERL
jgi:hypothetical protein